MNTSAVRLRYAPSPTGLMHIGNVRSALMSFLFARNKNGAFLIRIEDTDPQRNVDPQGKNILADLAWLKLFYDEGPGIGGPYAPYYQSERSAIYQEYLERLINMKLAYRCFCSQEELERKRLRQQALKQPPRYDRACMRLNHEDVDQKLAAATPFIWRFKVDEQSTVTIHDMARGDVVYDMENFGDCALTRQDGSFTFIFANFVDDLVMKISHVFRGEEHFSNTAYQAALYRAFKAEVPVFWHMPLICDARGKKLSKRDFGFSLNDIRNGGYLPEAILNYLATIGASFAQEIMTLEELITDVHVEKTASAGHIRYDLEKMRWMNHAWITKLDSSIIAERCKPFLVERFPEAQALSLEKLNLLIKPIQSELHTLAEVVDVLAFYFKRPVIDLATLQEHQFDLYKKPLQEYVNSHKELISSGQVDEFMKLLGAFFKERNLSIKPVYVLLRLMLSGVTQGHGIKDLLLLLEPQESTTRLSILGA